MYNNSLHGFHSREDTFLCCKKITREYRLIRDFNSITRYEVSQSVLLRCTRTDSFVNYRNIFSNLSALVSQTLWVRAGILLGSRSRFYRGEESIAPVDSWLLWHNMILDNSLKTFARKLWISRNPCRPTLSFSIGLLRTVCSFVCDFIALEIMESELGALHDDNFCYVP